MSHYYTIKQGSRLTDMCYEIYGSNKYYLEVAKINGLVNFNRLEPGQKLLFPPLGK
jgi:nucleoid-associated protein YgaU